MVTGRRAEELQGWGRPLSPSHPPPLHPSLAPRQDSSRDPHHSPPGFSGELPQRREFRLGNRRARVLPILPSAAQETAQLHGRQLQKVAAAVRCGSGGCGPRLESRPARTHFPRLPPPGAVAAPQRSAALAAPPECLLAPHAALLFSLHLNWDEWLLASLQHLSLPSSLLSPHSSPPLSHCAAFCCLLLTAENTGGMQTGSLEARHDFQPGRFSSQLQKRFTPTSGCLVVTNKPVFKTKSCLWSTQTTRAHFKPTIRVYD